MRRLLIAALIVSVLLCAGLPALGKSVTLRYKFNPGQIDNYKLTMDMKMSMPGMPGAPAQPINMSVSAIWAQKVLGVLPDGSAKIRMTFKHMDISAPGFPMGDKTAKVTKDASVILVMAPDGRILSSQGSAGLPGMDSDKLGFGKMINQMGIYGISTFPHQEVAVGQSWQNTIPLFGDAGGIKTDSTLQAAAVQIGKTVASRIDQTIQGKLDLATMMALMAKKIPSKQPYGSGPNPFASLKGSMDISGASSTFFSPDKGMLIKSDGVLRMVVQMQMPQEAVAKGAPAQMNLNLDMAVNVQKVK